jgi:hypothetical protein
MYKKKKGVCKDGGLEVPRRKRRRLRRLGVAVSSVANVAIAVGVSVGVSVDMSVDSVCVSIDGRRINRRGIAPEILLTFRRAITLTAHTSLFRHLHFSLIALVALASNCREEIYKEAENIAAVNEGNTPLETRRHIPHVLLRTHAKRNNHAHLEYDECQLDPETVAQNAVFAVPYTQTLVLPANKDGTNDVAADKDAEEDVVQLVVALAVENGEEDQARGAGDGGDSGAARIHFLPDGGVGREFAGVAEVAFEEEGEGEGYDGDGGHGDEHGFQSVGADIYRRLVGSRAKDMTVDMMLTRDIWDPLSLAHC